MATVTAPPPSSLEQPKAGVAPKVGASPNTGLPVEPAHSADISSPGPCGLKPAHQSDFGNGDDITYLFWAVCFALLAAVIFGEMLMSLFR
jgi:hypothetical protein